MSTHHRNELAEPTCSALPPESRSRARRDLYKDPVLGSRDPKPRIFHHEVGGGMLAYDLITIAFRYPECGHQGAVRRIEQRFHLIGTTALDEVELDERHGGLPNRFRWFRPDTPECDAA